MGNYKIDKIMLSLLVLRMRAFYWHVIPARNHSRVSCARSLDFSCLVKNKNIIQ